MAKPRLLVADDDEAAAAIVAQIARNIGFNPEPVTFAEDFKSAYLRSPPDLIVLDLGMPGEDGIELLRFLEAENCTDPILIVSGYDGRVLAAAERLGSARGLNIAAAVSKPLGVKQLKALLGALLPGSHASQAA